MHKDKATIVLADDHPIVRQGFARIIERDGSFSVVAEAGEGREALRLIHELKPDIAVLDIAMPGRNGLEIAHDLRHDRVSACRIVLLTMYRDREYFEEAMSLGIKGYILKDSAVADLLVCLRTIRAGGHYISPTLSGYLIHPGEPGPPAPLKILLDRLTPSEMAVLRLIAENKTSKETADALFVSYRTVQNHRFNMCRKLELKGHNKLLHFALKHKRFF